MFVKEYEDSEKTVVSKIISDTEEAKDLYTTIPATETLVCSLIVKYPYLIEEGLIYLDHQLTTGDHIRLDFLFADSEGTLVIAELKTEDSEEILLGCLEYYNEIVCNIEGYARIFKDKYGIKINPAKKPRMFLLAPNFAVNFIEKCRWVNIDVSAFAYKCIKPRYSEFVLPIFSEVKIPPIPHIFEALPEITAEEDEESEECEENEKDDVVVKEDDYKYRKEAPVKSKSYDIYFGSKGTKEADTELQDFEESVEKIDEEFENKED